MIRYYEFLYLAIAVGMAGFIAFSYKEMPINAVIGMSFGIAVASFMYSFRRQQRIKLEELERKHIEELKKEAGEDSDV